MSDRRQEIIDVSKALFAARGVRQTTVREIGDSSGILSGSLYHHFTSKLDIVDAILRDFCTGVLEGYGEIAQSDLTSTEALRQMSRFAFSLVNDHREAMIIIQDDFVDLTKDSATKDARFQYLVDFNSEVERRWMDAIKKGIKTGQLQAGVEPRAVYRFMRDAILGAIRWYEPQRGKSTDQLADSLVDMVLLGIATPSARRQETKKI